MVLSSHSTPASRLGNNRQVNITVRRSDDPFGVIQFIQPQLLFSINESKGMDIHSGIHVCYNCPVGEFELLLLTINGLILVFVCGS